MNRTWNYLICIALTSTAFAADLKLTDGRTLKDWSVLSQTASSLFVKHAGGATKVPKKLLPPDLLAKYPIDPGAVAKEAEALAAADAAGKTRRTEVAAAAKVEYENRVAAVAAAAAAKAAAIKALEAQRPQNAPIGHMVVSFNSLPPPVPYVATRDGLILDRVRTNSTSAFITLHNLSRSQQTFDWRAMKGKLRSGVVLDPTQIRMADSGERTDYTLEPGQSKNFELVFAPLLPSNSNYPDWLESVSWIEGSWIR